MRKIRLETKDGKLVRTLLIPHFDAPTQVMIWGARVFYSAEGDTYREVTWHVINPGV